jgi:hypothetical protein
MKRSKIIILNSPPMSGKDTIANLMMRNSLVDMQASFKKPLFDVARGVLGEGNFRVFMEKYNDRKTKEKPFPVLNGKSPRQFLIAISEDFIKPVMGDDYMGRYMADYVADAGADIVISDGGFDAEIIPLIDAGHDVRVFKLYRDGYTFKGDSRDYINVPDRALEYSLNLIDGDPEDAVKSIAFLAKLDPKTEL